MSGLFRYLRLLGAFARFSSPMKWPFAAVSS